MSGKVIGYKPYSSSPVNGSHLQGIEVRYQGFWALSNNGHIDSENIVLEADIHPGVKQGSMFTIMNINISNTVNRKEVHGYFAG